MMRLIALLCGLLFAGGVWAWLPNEALGKIQDSVPDDDGQGKKWSEAAVQLPAPPKDEKLLPFSIGAASPHKYFIDSDSLSLGTDDVVRYTLVILASGGAKNVSYEGMRCSTRERRVYAFGQPDGSWTQSRSNTWVKIQDGGVNRYHAALFLDYFCPNGVLVGDVRAIRRMFKQGGDKPEMILGR